MVSSLFKTHTTNIDHGNYSIYTMCTTLSPSIYFKFKVILHSLKL